MSPQSNRAVFIPKQKYSLFSNPGDTLSINVRSRTRREQKPQSGFRLSALAASFQRSSGAPRRTVVKQRPLLAGHCKYSPAAAPCWGRWSGMEVDYRHKQKETRNHYYNNSKKVNLAYLLNPDKHNTEQMYNVYNNIHMNCMGSIHACSLATVMQEKTLNCRMMLWSPDKMETWLAFFCFKQNTVAMESLWQQHLEYHASVPWWAAEETHFKTLNINR